MALEVDMPRGGARNRSGPPMDPNSGRSDARGVVLTALPNEGFQGTPPTFPMPSVSGRESELWEAAWRTPQAAAWSIQPWRHYVVAQWVRWSVRAEDVDAPASVVTAVIRFADQIGLTPAGLRENGWAIAADELAAKVAGQSSAKVTAPKSSRDRMKVVGGG